MSHESAALSAPIESVSPRRSPRDRIAEAGLIALLLLAPLPLGSVHAGAMFVMMVWIAALAWLTVPWGADDDRLPAAMRPWAWLVLGVLGVAGLQLLPLPTGLVRALSPSAAKLRDQVPLSEPGGWMRLSIHPEATVGAIALLAAVMAAFLISATLAARGGGAHRRILGAIFGVGVFQAAYGSAEYLSGHQHILGMAKRFYTDSATGTYVNQNHFAGLLEMALLVGLGFLLAHAKSGGGEASSSGSNGLRGSSGSMGVGGAGGPKDWRQRIVSLFEERRALAGALAIGTAVVGLGLVFSYSRAGIAGASVACAGVLLIHAARGRDRRWLAPMAILVGGLLLLITLAGWDRTLADLKHQMQPISLDRSRVRVWRDTLHIIADYPLFGTGLGTFPDIYPAYRNENIQLIYDAAHNDYLQLVAEAGALGVVAAIGLLGVYGVWTARRMSRYLRPDFPLLLGAAGGAGALLLHETVDFNLHIPANALLFAVLCGTLLGALASRGEGSAVPTARVLPFTSSRLRRRSRP